LSRLFLISPASTAGERARQLFSESARFDLALRLRSEAGVTLGEAFSFLSSLYFRGKLAYASAFANAAAGVPGVLVITSSEGLLPPGERFGLDRLRRLGEVDIAANDKRYREPLLRDAAAIESELKADPASEVVLLGSVASGKYVEVLSEVFGPRLRFPAEFVGRGDMSRGGLLLRCVVDRRELDYAPVGSIPRRGHRPARLVPRPGILKRL
jgi:hypothetical protein